MTETTDQTRQEIAQGFSQLDERRQQALAEEAARLLAEQRSEES